MSELREICNAPVKPGASSGDAGAAKLGHRQASEGNRHIDLCRLVSQHRKGRATRLLPTHVALEESDLLPTLTCQDAELPRVGSIAIPLGWILAFGFGPPFQTGLGTQCLTLPPLAGACSQEDML